MANTSSAIDPTGIDETYPVAGKDNDTAGFRNNFSSIKTNFATAEGEISDILLNGARYDRANNFNGNNIVNANIIQSTEGLKYLTNISSNTNLDFALGVYQSFNLTAQNITLTLTNFPAINVSTGYANGVSKMYVELSASAITCTASNGTADNITCSSVVGLSTNMPIMFTGNTFGGVVAKTVYYVKTIVSNTITISTTPGGAAVNLNDGSGTMNLCYLLVNFTSASSGAVYKYSERWPSMLLVSDSNHPMIFEFWTYNGGYTVYCDYHGMYS